MKIGSLFSGGMGLDLGLEYAGHEIIWACESDKWCRRVIAKHYPKLHVYYDVEEVKTKEVPEIDVLVGGFP